MGHQNSTDYTIALFALTGMGNTVLRRLIQEGHTPKIIVTRPETGPFPYYKEENIASLAARHSIPCLFDGEGEAQVTTLGVDLILVASYHRILDMTVIQSASRAVNTHPSLLPDYAGPNPFYAVLANGASCTGITIHDLSEKIDGGDIYWQNALTIHNMETQGSLRQRLSTLAAEGASEFIRSDLADTLSSSPQKAQKQMHPAIRPMNHHRTLDPNQSMEKIARQSCALSPYPGIVYQDFTFLKLVSIERNTPRNKKHIGVVSFDNNTATVQTKSAKITFEVAKNK